MATTYVTMANLTRYDSNMKTYIDSDKTKSLKGYLKKDNTYNFYTTATPTEDSVPVVSIDIPTEFFLDQAKTVLVPNFAWSEETYAGSTNPELEGKPVFVLAVKGDDNTLTYSFLNMETLVDVYTGETTNVAKVVVSADNKISVELILSAEEGNILSIKEDGLYASVTEVDISGKADKLATENAKSAQILVDDGNGNLSASGKTIAEVIAEANAEFVSMTDDEIDNLFA